MRVDNGQSRARWSGRACSISQGFVLRKPALEPGAILQRLDAHLLACTRAAGFGLLRWQGGALMLGSLCVLRLGALEPCAIPGFAAAAERMVLGGLSAHRGGRLLYDLRLLNGDLALHVRLLGFKPRLPRLLFSLTQAQMHQAAVRRAVRGLAADYELNVRLPPP
jgi:hypothetical protein